MVLGKLSVPGRHTNLDESRARRVRAVWTFFVSSIISTFFLPLSGRGPEID